MRIVNEPENEGQYIELRVWPPKFSPVRRDWSMSFGWSGWRNWTFGVEFSFENPRSRAVLIAVGPLYIALVGDR